MASRHETPNLVAELDAVNVLDDIFGTHPRGREMIPVQAIHTAGGTQMRAALSNDTVSEYRDALLEGAVLPPIVVFYDGQEYWLADGFHRVAAHRQAYGTPGSAYKDLSKPEISADVRAGTRRDAVLYAAQANASHGLRRTNADKQRAVRALLEDPEWSQWSDGEIARKCAVSQPFVSSLRPKSVAPTHNGYESTQEPIVRKGSDGRTINTANIGKTKEAQPYAQVYELESAIRAFGNVTAAELREAARKGDGYMFWSRIRDAVDAKSLRWRKADLTQALNNVAAQMEAKAGHELSARFVATIEPTVEVMARTEDFDIFGSNTRTLCDAIVARCKQDGIIATSTGAYDALINVRNSLVAEKREAQRQAQRETAAPTPAPATTDKPMVEWTEAEWEAAEAEAKGQDAELAAKNAARRDAAIDILETYRQVVRTEKQYSELTGDFMGTIAVMEGMRKMIAGLERLVEALQ